MIYIYIYIIYIYIYIYIYTYIKWNGFMAILKYKESHTTLIDDKK